MEPEQVILVDPADNPIGLCDKLQAHKEGLLHRAFSVCLVNHKGEMLLQKRASHKYHGGGLWTNACCSHPRQHELLEEAAKRRLKEEMGIVCEIQPAFSLTYRADMGNGLIEHEFDHVFSGIFDGVPEPDAREVEDWKFVPIPEILRNMVKAPETYSPWFKLILPKFTETFSLAS